MTWRGERAEDSAQEGPPVASVEDGEHMKITRRVGAALIAAVFAVSVLGAAPAQAKKDTSWGGAGISSPTQARDTSWGGAG